MAKKTVEIVIAASDKASKAIKALAKGLSAVGKASGVAAAGIGAVNKGIEGAFDVYEGVMSSGIVQAGQMIHELARFGAQSLRTERAFEAIAGGADEAKRRLDAMSRATHGAMSEQDMMAQASRLMQMGLANNAGELAQITEMATRLGSAMGLDANNAIEQFSLTLANQSIPRLDAFGISAGKVRKKIADLQAAHEEAKAAEEPPLVPGV